MKKLEYRSQRVGSLRCHELSALAMLAVISLGSLCCSAHGQNTLKVIPGGGAGVLDRSANLITNGSFENGRPADFTKSIEYWIDLNDRLLGTGTDAGNYLWAQPGDPNYAPVPGWTVSGSASNYAQWFNRGFLGSLLPSDADPATYVRDPVLGEYAIRSDFVPDGTSGLYFGNFYLPDLGTDVLGLSSDGVYSFSTVPSPTYTAGYEGGVSLSQTVTGLTVGETYQMSFWVGGEYAATREASGSVHADGLFRVNLEAHDPMWLAIPSGVSSHSIFSGGSWTYLLEFTATDTEMDLEFFNAGHPQGSAPQWNAWTTSQFGSPATAEELVLDDVIINQIPEPSSTLLICGSGLLLMLRHRGS